MGASKSLLSLAQIIVLLNCLDVIVGSGFTLINNARTFSQAQTLCRLKSGDIAHIFNADQQDTVVNYLKNLAIPPNAWIGLRGNRKDKTMRWIGGPNLGIPFSNWDEGESEKPISTWPETCVSVKKDGKWVRSKCDDNNLVVCQNDRVNETALLSDDSTTIEQPSTSTEAEITDADTYFNPADPVEEQTTTADVDDPDVTFNDTTITVNSTSAEEERYFKEYENTTCETTELPTSSSAKPQTTPEPSCRDASSNCLFLSEMGFCVDKTIKNECKKSCGLCPGIKVCKDETINCIRIANKYSCNYDTVKRICPSSCGVCQKANQVSTCRNTMVPCSRMKQFCEVDWYQSLMNAFCPQTCGLCKYEYERPNCRDKGISCTYINTDWHSFLKPFCANAFGFCKFSKFSSGLQNNEQCRSFKCSKNCSWFTPRKNSYLCKACCVQRYFSKDYLPCQNTKNDCEGMIEGFSYFSTNYCQMFPREASLNCPRACNLCKGSSYNYNLELDNNYDDMTFWRK